MAKKTLPKASEKKNHCLVLIDHDGTLCDTNPYAYESMKFATEMACRGVKLDLKNLNINWEDLFAQTQGTTEKNYLRIFCFRYAIPFADINFFEERYYEARTVWYRNMKSFHENPYDTYYPDTENLINICNHRPNLNTWLMTGNPRQVMKERLAKHLLNYFSDERQEDLQGAFGDEAYSRDELFQIAIKKAELSIKGFKIIRDSLGFATNVIYIGDGRKDFFSALNAKIVSVWVPSRKLQETKEIATQDYMVFLKKMLGKRIQVVNRVDAEEVLSLIGINKT